MKFRLRKTKDNQIDKPEKNLSDVSPSFDADGKLKPDETHHDHKLNETQTEAHLNSDPLVFFLMCIVAGAVTGGLARALLTPFDLVKVRMKVKTPRYTSTRKGLRIAYKEGGMKGIYVGWVPTLIGYACNGAVKFFFYEFFKYIFTKYTTKRFLIYMTSGAIAEFISIIILAPFETVKVKMMTNERLANKGMIPVMKLIYEREGMDGFFKNLVPLWKQSIPFQMLKFIWFEITSDYLYHTVPSSFLENKWEHLLVTFLAGFASGCVVAVLSQPADYLVETMEKNRHSPLIETVLHAGFQGIYNGVMARILIIGILTGLQLSSYDLFKMLSISYKSLFISLMVQYLLNTLLDLTEM